MTTSKTVRQLKSKVLISALLSVAAGPQVAPVPAAAPPPAQKAAPAPAPAAAPTSPAAKPATPAVAKPATPAVAKPAATTTTQPAGPVAATKPGTPAATPDVKPTDGPFTLAQATAGLVGNGALRAAIEVEQGGKALGTLRCELYADKAPLTVANFVGLARGVRPFRDPHSEKWLKKPLFDGSQFHRTVPDFMIQTGDTWCYSDVYCGGRHGAGDPGYAIPDEIRDDLRFDRVGRMGMAQRGSTNSGGSQFFITDKDTPWLNGSHTIFGQCEPVDLIHTIANVETLRLDVPKVPVRIKRVTVSRQPAPINK
jgi:peptidyl-prolyl cis-trans isomerase A (cyclophilin A)